MSMSKNFMYLVRLGWGCDHALCSFGRGCDHGVGSCGTAQMKAPAGRATKPGREDQNR